MWVIRKLREVNVRDLGSDNTLMNDPSLGAYLVKDADFHAGRAGEVKVYPVTRESGERGVISEYMAELTAEDYRNVVTVRAFKPENNPGNN